MSVRVDAVPPIDPDDDVLHAALLDIAGIVPLPDIIDDLAADPYAGAGDAWERMVEAIAAELRPTVARLVDAAYRRRLPWRWPPA